VTRIYTFVNQKGGVGKTTTSINLGAYLAAFDQRVLVVDLDPQANATSCLGVDKLNVSGGTYEALINGVPASSFILLNEKLKLSLLPSSPALAGAEVELVEVLARETRLKKALEPLRGRYDYILIDCPPSLGLLTVNGLVAAQDGVIVPVQCEYLALEGLGQLTRTIQRVRFALFPDLRVRGETVVMATLDAPEQQRLAGLPSVLAPVDHQLFADVYLVPPAKYPDGSVRLKLGATRHSPIALDTADERRAWMSGDAHRADLDGLRSFVLDLVPGLRAEAWETKPCLLTDTPTGLPYVDLLADGLVIAAGCNGYAAKSGDAIGAMAAQLAIDGRWTDTVLAAERFAVVTA